MSQPVRVGHVAGAAAVVAGLTDTSRSAGAGQAEHRVRRLQPLLHRHDRIVSDAELEQRPVLQMYHLTNMYTRISTDSDQLEDTAVRKRFERK